MDIKKSLKTEMPDARERENRLKVGKDSMQLIESRKQASQIKPEVISINQFIAER